MKVTERRFDTCSLPARLARGHPGVSIPSSRVKTRFGGIGFVIGPLSMASRGAGGMWPLNSKRGQSACVPMLPACQKYPYWGLQRERRVGERQREEGGRVVT